MATDRLRWWLTTVATTQPEEMDCETLFEMLEVVAEAVNAGRDIAELFPAIAVHLDHCPSCRELFETLVALTEGGPG